MAAGHSFEKSRHTSCLSPDEQIRLEILRDGERREVSARLDRQIETDRFGQRSK